MGNDLVTTDRALGLPALASMALSRRPWTIEDGIAAAGDDIPAAVEAAVAYINRAFEPVPGDREGRVAWKAALDERLRRLAVKIAPGMSVEQATEWRVIMVDALADLPAMIALTAAKRAIHRPMRFLNEVEHVVREIATQVTAERRHARSRVEDLLAAPPRKALPPQAEGAPLSADEIAKMPRWLLELGVGLGEIDPGAVPASEEPARRARDGRTAPRVPTEADYAAMGITPEMLAASRAAAAAELEAIQAAPAAPAQMTGPAVEEGGDCPHCGTPGVTSHGGSMFCDALDCGKVWTVEPTRAAA